MKNILIYLTLAICAFFGCVSNDLPYPVVIPNVTSVIVDEADKVEINHERRSVTIYLPESSDIRNVVIRSVHVDQEIAVLPEFVVGIHDLTTPLKFKITTYADYEWTITAVRTVSRVFNVEGQVGATTFDEVNHRAMAMIGKKGDLSEVTVTALKLGADGVTTYSVQKEDMHDFTSPVNVDVTEFGYTETWTLLVVQTDLSIGVQRINPWTYTAYVTTIGMAGVENEVVYRPLGTQEWIKVPEGDVTSDGGSFVAYIQNLMPETEYEVAAVSGEEMSEVKTFTTAAATQIPNGSFEYASLVEGTSYYKFYDPSCGVEDGIHMFWGSGNGEGSEGVNGSANMGIVITYIDTQDKVHGQQSVRAQTSQLAGILAAGNLFTGQFAGLVGTSGGMVNFGRPWTTRPVALKLYCKYETSNVDIIGATPPGVNLTKDDYDSAEIKVALGNWDYKKYGGTPSSPIHINTTNSATFVDFRTDASTIAHGGLVINHDGYVLNDGQKVEQTTSNWLEYTIPLDYHTMDLLPTHIVISCAASRYGDYFTGCSSSKLWIDAVELIY